MALSRVLVRRVQLPAWLALLLALAAGLITLWAIAVANDRNPLPFPDRHYHVHSASSTEALITAQIGTGIERRAARWGSESWAAAAAGRGK